MLRSFGNLEALLAGVHRQAQQRGLASETEAQQRAKALGAKAEVEVSELLETSRQQASSEAAALQQRLLAQAELEAKRLWLSAREDVLERVFAQAEDELRALLSSPDYEAVLEGFARQAAKELSGPSLMLSSDPLGHPLLKPERLAVWSKSAGIAFNKAEQAADIWGGLLAESGRERYDASFDSRLAEARLALRETIFKALMKEAP